VLTGAIAGLLTQGFLPGAAARAGVYLHGAAADRLAGRKGPCGFLASEVARAFPVTLRRIMETRDRPPVRSEGGAV